MTYTFVKIKSKLDTKEYWLFHPKDELQVIEHWYKYPASIIKEGTQKLVRKALRSELGHCNNDFERAVETYMDATGKDLRTSLVECENLAFNSRLNSIRNHTDIYLNHGIQVIMLDEKIVEVVDKIESSNLTFPDEVKPTENDIKILQWPGGIHYYAKIGKLDITDKDGNQKWSTEEEAKAAAKWFIINNWD